MGIIGLVCLNAMPFMQMMFGLGFTKHVHLSVHGGMVLLWVCYFCAGNTSVRCIVCMCDLSRFVG